jgi:hypothetical protein
MNPLNYYQYLVDDHPYAYAQVLKFMDITQCLEILKSMTEEGKASALFLMGESKRIKILNSMNDTTRKMAVESLRSRQIRLDKEWGVSGVPDFSIAIDDPPKSYAQSATKCVVCDSLYSIGQSIFRADCGFHSFHELCTTTEDICPKCQPPNEVFPHGPMEYLKKSPDEMEEMAVTGFGYYYPYKYISISFHSEKREMHWYYLPTIERMFGDKLIKKKITEFLHLQLAEIEDTVMSD